ncbi:MAG TPA: hypothetical protein VIO62_13625 [Candidatus Dormibacteraeota bacterium]|jgi:hypothetical protein
MIMNKAIGAAAFGATGGGLVCGGLVGIGRIERGLGPTAAMDPQPAFKRAR